MSEQILQAKRSLQHGVMFPFDAPDEWWNGSGDNPPASIDHAHAAARGVIADLQDRGGIKHCFNDLDEDIREEIVTALAAIIRQAYLSKVTSE